MLKFRTLFALAAMTMMLAFVATGAHAQLKQGRDYEPVNPPQPTEKGKIEVIEFFSYMCPHCANLDPLLAKWQKTLAKDVVFTRVPVVFSAAYEATSKLYLTLDAMGELEKYHSNVFAAVHPEYPQWARQGGVANPPPFEFADLKKEAGVIDWAAKKGLDRKKFSDTYNSFAVKSKFQGIEKKQKAYGIDGVPAFVVAGKYRNPAQYEGGFEGLLKLVDQMIAQARLEQGKK